MLKKSGGEGAMIKHRPRSGRSVLIRNFKPAWADRLKTVTKPMNISGQTQTETCEYDKVFVGGVDT
jgi:hypothetical protein